MSDLMLTKGERSAHYLVWLILFSVIYISFLEGVIPGARYVKYTLPVFVVFFWVFNGAMHGLGNIYLGRAVIPFVIVVIYGAVQQFFYPSIEGMKDIFFIFVGFIPFLFFDILNDRKFFDRLFYVFALLYCLKMAVVGQVNGEGIVGAYEGTESFVFGIFAICYFQFGSFRHFSVACFFVLLSLKRIAFLGVLFGVLSIVAVPILMRVGLLRIRIGFFLILVVSVIFLFGLSLGYFDEYFGRYFGVSSNQLTMGRFNIYSYVFGDFERLISFWGLGFGWSYELVSAATLGADKNLHSDILKIFFEGGLVLFLLFFYFLSRSINYSSLPLVLYLFCLFLTDNVLVYPQVMFFWLYAVFISNKCRSTF
ncbi:hypothetical protein M0G74_14085 [Microbulbifer sp. CAU 1566]|uniref:hypothetical protein n=1 Tax=Microbulbifer sp. CAU 1566 TaxID=2933269 RepID=UPI002003E038|nr:hypothetical protein [Microbulbifer sp. CAU 1566]MCK7598406.1 hypothetical protein [Microbulbifer sp. CAU 1566]